MRRCAIALTALLITACSAPAPAPTAPTPSAPPTTIPPASPSPTPTEPAFEVPVVIAVHHSRGTADISLELANQLIENRPTQWGDLGMPGDAVSYAEGSEEELVQAVIDDADTLAVLPATAVDERVRVLHVDGTDPLREPESYPLQTETEQELEPVVTLSVVGDIMLGRRVGERYDGDLEAVFEPFAERLAAADITVGNLESTLSMAGDPTQGGDSFAADPAALEALTAAGFDAVTLANNHLGDYGTDAMLETFRLIDESDIDRFGAGVDLDEAARPWIAEVDGVRIAFIGTESIGETPAATESEPGTNRLNMPPRTPPLDEKALDRIAGQITQAAEQADVVIVMPHWGTQYVYEPEPIQREVAQRFVDAGADLILGGHPHQVQGWEAIGETTVVYSLPNFIFDMTFSQQVQEGMFVEVVLWGDRVVAVEPVPYLIRDYIPQPADAENAERILQEMRSTGLGPYAEPGEG